MIKRLFTVIVFLLVVAPGLAAPAWAQQSSGQFWVQAFEDRNANGAHDPGEPFLTSGVSVDLLNAEGVVMASGTLDDAPFASQGYIGFLYLAPGNYTAVITSPELAPTTPERVEISITEAESLIRASYGAQRAADVEAAASEADSGLALVNPQVARLALAGFGAMLVVGVMAVLGVLIYLVVLRRRAPVEAKRTTTGSMRAVQVYDTEEHYRAEVPEETGSGKRR